MERNAKTSGERLGIAKEVLAGPGVTVMEAWSNELFLRKHTSSRESQKVTNSPKDVHGVNPELHGTGL